MVSEARKLHLIEKVLSIDSEGTITAIENLINSASNKKINHNKPFLKFAGIWSEEEGNEISKIIADTCEQVNPNDWK